MNKNKNEKIIKESIKKEKEYQKKLNSGIATLA